MSHFRSPKRRLTRQRSGFKVSGKSTGSTCRIETAHLLLPTSGRIAIHVQLPRITAQEIFFRKLALLGGGSYVRPEENCDCTLELSWKQNGKVSHVTSTVHLTPNKWNKIGLLTELPLSAKQEVLSDISFDATFITHTPLHLFSYLIGTLNDPYFLDHDVYTAYKTKPALYVPEMLYLDPVQDTQPLKLTVGTLASKPGAAIVCKSCNRCARFLPIDIENELNSLAFSNHCASGAPCKHSAFSIYQIEAGDPTPIAKHCKDGTVISHYGHQLECRVCKNSSLIFR